MTIKKIERHLKFQINIIFISINDNSIFHRHSKKGLTHLNIIIVSNDFLEKKIIMRHRMIFSILSEINEDKIYSITLNTYTLEEWKKNKNKKNNISNCLKKNNIFKIGSIIKKI